jgi:hypothetical protein
LPYRQKTEFFYATRLEAAITQFWMIRLQLIPVQIRNTYCSAICAVWLQPADLRIIAKGILDYFQPHAIAELQILNWKKRFNSAIEIAMHQIGASKIELFGAAVVK